LQKSILFVLLFLKLLEKLGTSDSYYPKTVPKSSAYRSLTRFPVFFVDKRKMNDREEDEFFTCGKCKQHLSKEKFSKKQFKKLEKDKDCSLKCVDCTKLVETTEKKVSKEKKVKKLVDPSQLYILHPLNAPIMKDFEKFFLNQYDLKSEITVGKKTKWRTAVKLAVRGEIGEDRKLRTEIGLFGPGSHNVIDCSHSPAHHSRINEAVEMIKNAIEELKIGGYIEGTAAEDKKIAKYNAFLRYILLSVERKSGLIQLSLVWNSSKINPTTASTNALTSLVEYLTSKTIVNNSETFKSKRSKLFHSIWVHYHPADIHNNAITNFSPDSWELKFGKEYMLEHVNTDFASADVAVVGAGKSENDKKKILPTLHFPPFVFRQANIDKFEEIIQEIRTNIKDFKVVNALEMVKCLELYGGVGTIGLNCLDLVDRLNCSDENPHNLVCFNKSLDLLPNSLKLRGQYRPYGAANSLKNGEIFQHNLVIVDPPRKGMDEETIKAFLASPPSENTVNKDSEAAATKRVKISFDEEGNVNDGTTASTKNSSMQKKRLIYISCGFDAFKRDCQLLTGKMSMEEASHLFHSAETNAGGDGNRRKRKEIEPAATPSYQNYWKLIYSKGFVLFPGSNHIETLAVFDRE
jgi:tRNA/tmRNA/rRNA uracil-C5-methylase (TrmA/RlmC/RlmD family)